MLSVLMIVGALLGSPVQAKPSDTDCRVHDFRHLIVCQVYPSGTGLIRVTYKDHLLRSGKTVYARGFLNGRPFSQPVTVEGTFDRNLTGSVYLKGPARETLDLTLYFVSADGKYDSDFGRNYNYRFQPDR